MERQKYISLVAELRQIVVAKALTLLDDHDAAEDVAGEVLMKLWERHEELHDDTEKVKHLANVMAKNLSLNASSADIPLCDFFIARRKTMTTRSTYPTFPSHSPLINMWKTKKRATSFIAPLVSFLTTGEKL